jgi:hypothetical protein
MSVELDELVEVVRREVSPPGSDLFPNATDDEFLGNLRDAFWEARLFGFFNGFTEADGSVSPTSGTTDLGRDQQQLIVLFAGARILRNEIRNMNTSFRAKAGPVEFEQAKSAQVLKSLLDDVRSRIIYLLQAAGSTQTYYIDAVIGREESINFGATEYVTGRGGYYSTYDGHGTYGSW